MDPKTEGNRAAGSGISARVARLRQRIAGRMRQGFYSEFRGYGMRRDLSRPLDKPQARIPLHVRPLKPEDLDLLLPLEAGLAASERQQIEWRRHFYKKMPKGCIVAVDARSGSPCYMQWLLGPDDNHALARFKCFPTLERNEALLEQAYTVPSHRGLGVMSAAMAEIAELARGMGAEHVLTFLDENSDASMKACRRAGFMPYLEHRRIQIGYGTIVRNTFRKIALPDAI